MYKCEHISNLFHYHQGQRIDSSYPPDPSTKKNKAHLNLLSNTPLTNTKLLVEMSSLSNSYMKQAGNFSGRFRRYCSPPSTVAQRANSPPVPLASHSDVSPYPPACFMCLAKQHRTAQVLEPQYPCGRSDFGPVQTGPLGPLGIEPVIEVSQSFILSLCNSVFKIQ